MLARDYKDIGGGALLIAVGLLFALYAGINYEIGTLRRMGPGMFPAALGAVLTIFGVLLAIPAFFRRGEMPTVRIWTPIFVLAGTAAFAATVRPLGLIPAVIAVVVISSFAELKVRPLSLAILTVSLCVIAWLVFSVGLNLPLVMFSWQF